jgi:hypothetical protein
LFGTGIGTIGERPETSSTPAAPTSNPFTSRRSRPFTTIPGSVTGTACGQLGADSSNA